MSGQTSEAGEHALATITEEQTRAAAGGAPRGAGVRTLEISAADARKALRLARRCASQYASVSDPEFIDEAGMLAQELPRSVREFAHAARLDDTKHGVLISGNLVEDRVLGPTPLHWGDADTPGSRPYAFLISLYGALFGDVIGWATQQDGHLVTDVLPTPGLENSLVSSCSESPLGWHTEDAFSPHRADYVGLLCLRSPDEVPTTISYVDISSVPADIADLLGERRYMILPDSSHDPALTAGETAGHVAPLEELRTDPPKVAVLSGHPDAPVLRIDRDFTMPEAGDTAADRALNWLVGHLDGNTYDVPLHPGDICFIDNRNVVHGRRAFRARYDGTDRWLKRVNVVADLRRTLPGRARLDSRVIG